MAWSTTVIMKIDLVGPHRRGFAMGLRPEPFYLGIAFVALGLACPRCSYAETRGHAEAEAEALSHVGPY